jgi:hypothetical protein
MFRMVRTRFHIRSYYATRKTRYGATDIFWWLEWGGLNDQTRRELWIVDTTPMKEVWKRTQAIDLYLYTQSVVTVSTLQDFAMRSLPVRNATRTQVWFSAATELGQKLHMIPATQKMYFQRDGAPHTSVDTWRSTWMSSSMIDGLVVVVSRIDHFGHRTSLP